MTVNTLIIINFISTNYCVKCSHSKHTCIYMIKCVSLCTVNDQVILQYFWRASHDKYVPVSVHGRLNIAHDLGPHGHLPRIQLSYNNSIEAATLIPWNVLQALTRTLQYGLRIGTQSSISVAISPPLSEGRYYTAELYLKAQIYAFLYQNKLCYHS